MTDSSNPATPEPPTGKRTEQYFPIVGIGASAGGLEAFTLFLNALSPDTGMAFIVVQHLDPTHRSGLADLLANETELPVKEIKDGMAVRPNTIYVNPENVEVTIEGGSLHLHPRTTRSFNLPINRFLSSLADDQHDKAIGVILSGAATDGTLGLLAIHNAGGTTFAQDKSASAEGMPTSAIQAGAVDSVLPPDEIAKTLKRISARAGKYHSEAGTNHTSGVAPSGLSAILDLVRRRVGVNMESYKVPTLSRRIHRRLVLLNLDSLSEYAAYLENHPAEIDTLYQDMLINVSHMFRDEPTLELLKNKVLPVLVAKRPAEQPIRIWVAGCASGEEAYSLAIICREFLDRWSLTIPVQIFATDLSAPMIALARSGLYTSGAMQEVSESRKRRFFTQEGDKYRVTQAIREMCVFAEHNLLVNPPFSQMDLISCCNVLIYFKLPSQQKAINAFHYALKPSGFLVLSPSETVGNSRALFSLLDKKHKVYTRKAAMTPSYLNPESKPPTKPAGLPRRAPERADEEVDIGKLADNLLLARFTPGSVVIDNDMEIVQFRGTTTPYLEPGSGKASLNIFKMVRPGLAMHLRKSIREAKKNQQPFQSDIVIKDGKRSTIITLEVLPLMTGGVAESYFLVVFADKLDTGQEVWDESVMKSSKTDAKDRQILQLDLELAEAQVEMRRISEDHEAVVQELQLSNEEIRSSNEELQTLNEELETSSEELASTNEELITMNQSLRESNDQLKVSRDFAETLIRTVRESLIVLDPDLKIKTASDSFYKNFAVTPKMTEGKYLYDLGDGQWRIPKLQALLEDILPKNSYFQNYIVEHDFPGVGHKKMLLNARRIVTDDEGGEGHMIMLAIEDITDKKQPADKKAGEE